MLFILTSSLCNLSTSDLSPAPNIERNQSECFLCTNAQTCNKEDNHLSS